VLTVAAVEMAAAAVRSASIPLKTPNCDTAPLSGVA
jgi:hypothetical protein